MSVLIKHMAMPKGCIYANDKDQTEYCPLLNHDDVPFCQYIENEPEIAIGIDERPVYCPLSDVPETCQDAVSRSAVIDIALQYCPDDDGVCSKAGHDPREMLDEIEDLPSVQPEPHWIPVTERLPNREEYIQCNGLFIVSDGDRAYAEYFDIYDKKCFGEPVMHGFRADRAVTAWMPFPEAYQAERRTDG